MTQNHRNTILITGASSGVGRSLTHYLSDRFHVVALARRVGRMQDAFGENEQVTTYAVDLSDRKATLEAVESIRATHGPILYLINNAGVNFKNAINSLSLQEMDYSLQVNAIAPLLLMQAMLPDMEEHGFGRIINVTSGAPLNCFPKYAAYSSSKGTLNAITVTAAREYEDQNIKINLMSPGPVRTEMAPEAPMEPSACHETVDYLLSLDEDGPTGRFFWLGHEIPLFPELDGIKWLEGKADERYRNVLSPAVDQ